MAVQYFENNVFSGEVNVKAVNNTMYRNNCGTGETNPQKVIAFEMSELNNLDIPNYLLEHYGNIMTIEVKSMLEEVLQKIDNTDLDEAEAKEVADTIVREMERIWHIKIARVIWLAEYKAIVELYGGNKNNIKEYPTSNYILSNLGYDGILFAYPK